MGGKFKLWLSHIRISVAVIGSPCVQGSDGYIRGSLVPSDQIHQTVSWPNTVQLWGIAGFHWEIVVGYSGTNRAGVSLQGLQNQLVGNIVRT